MLRNRKLLLLLIWLLAIFPALASATVSLSATSVVVGGSVWVSWSGFSGNVNLLVYKGTTQWVEANTNVPGSGSQELNTTGWELRSDYRVKVVLRSNTSIYEYSSYLTVQALPDLTVSSVSGPTTANVGKSVNVSVTVNRTGGSLTNGTYVQVNVYLSTDSSITTSDTLIGQSTTSQFLNSTLNSSGSASGTISCTLPASTGTYYIGAIADAALYHPESNESNNSKAGNLIQIGSLTVTAPNGGEVWTQGQTYTIQWTSSNVTGTVDIDIYKGATNYSRIAGGQAASGSYSWTPSTSWPTGSDWRAAVSGMSGNVYDFSNNYFTLQAPLPDLTVSSVSGPSTANVGRPINVSVTVNRTGGSLTNGTYVQVNVYLSPDSTITTSDTLIGQSTSSQFLNSTLNSSGTASATIGCMLPGSAGTYYIGAIADPALQHPESNESNNSKAGNLIQIGSLTVTAPNGGETWTKGVAYTISWTSSNVTGTVDIDIYKGGTNYSRIAGGQAASGSFSWTPPTGWPSGSDYQAAVSAMSGNVFDFSNANFTLQAPGSISGGVRDNNTSLAISGALVRLEQSGQIKYTTNSATDGTYSITNVVPGTYNLVSIKTNYYNWIESRTIGVGQNLTTQNIAMLPSFDLTSSATVGSSYKSGQTGVQIPVTVSKSGGNLPSTGHVHAKLYFSTNSTWDTGDTVLWSSNDSIPDFPNSTLNSSGSRQVTATVEIPSVSAGTYYIISYADAPQTSYPSGYYTENNESNNTAAYSCTVSQNGSISGGVRDNNTSTALSGALVRLEQSGQIKYTTNSATDGTYSIAEVVPGTYNLVSIKTNYQNWIESRTIGANQNLTNQNIAMIPIYDLTSAATVQSSYNSGQTGVQIPVTVSKAGGGLPSSGCVHAKLYFSTNSTWDTGDTVLWSSNDSLPDFPNSTLNSSGSKQVTATVAIPSVSGGTYYLISYADAPQTSYPNGYYAESNETNNTTVYSFSVIQATPPDLTVSAASGPTIVNAKQSGVNVNVTVNRTGGPLVNGTYVFVGVYISLDPTISVTDTLIGQSTSAQFLNTTLNSSGSASATIPCTLPDTTGYYYLGAIADPTEYHPESDESNNWKTANTIQIGKITVVAPNGGEKWMHGMPYSIQWNSSIVTGTLSIDVYKGGTNYQRIASGQPLSGSLSWTVPTSWPAGSDYKVAVSGMSGNVWDFSDNSFSLVPPASITVTYPNGGETLVQKSDYTVTWTSASVSGNVRVHVWRNGAYYQTLAADYPNTGSIQFNPLDTWPASGGYQIGISALDNSASDLSNGYFTIASPCSITVTYPNGGESWERNKSYTITWNSSNVSGNVRVSAYKAGSNYQTLNADCANTGSLAFTLPESWALGNDYQIQVNALNGLASDSSNGFFSVAQGGELVLEPIGNKTTKAGEALDFLVCASGGQGTLTYSASNLPSGASFNPSTRRFIWSYPAAGVYPNVHFEVTDGVVKRSENITITVTEDIPKITVQGKVTDSYSGNPIANATVTLNPYTRGERASKQTDASGNYSFVDAEAGKYNISVSKDSYRTENKTADMPTAGTYTHNFALTSVLGNSIQLTSQLKINADKITGVAPGPYTLSGNVHINGILYFDGNVTVDNRGQVDPELTGSCGFYAASIEGQNRYILSAGRTFKYYAVGDELIPRNASYILLGSDALKVGGFKISVGHLIVDEEGDFVEVKAVAQMPYPINRIFDYIKDSYIEKFPGGSVIGFIQQISAVVKLSKTDGISTSANIQSSSSANFGVFALDDLSISYDTGTELFTGSVVIKIPGVPQARDLSRSQEIIPLKIIDRDTSTIHRGEIHDLLVLQRASGLNYLELGVEIDFLKGAYDGFSIDVSTKIPLWSTGLEISKIKGSLKNIHSPEWRLGAFVDIETALPEIPVLGEPIEMVDCGVQIGPGPYFKGTTTLKIFGNEVGGSFLEYDGDVRKLKAEARLVIKAFDTTILGGTLNASVKKGQFAGSANLTARIGELVDAIPVYWRWLVPRNLPEQAIVSVANRVIQGTLMNQEKEPLLAVKLDFVNSNAPYFHCYVGENHQKLYQIWRGTRDDRQVVTFQVPENYPQLWIVAGNDTNLFDFTVKSPSGKEYNSSNTFYRKYDEAKQTLMLIERTAENGSWTFSTDQTGEFMVEALGADQEPTMLFCGPASLRTRSNTISIDFADYNNDLEVEVFYDTDNKHFDGESIQSFQLKNSSSCEFVWQNEDVPNGEYYIYCIISDGKNAPVMQYAPGSILVENDTETETPKNFTAIQQGDLVHAEWDAPLLPNTIGSTVYYQNISTGRIEEISLTNRNALDIPLLKAGQEYKLWCCFFNTNYTTGPKSNEIDLVFASTTRNNPPYFTLEPGAEWEFTVGQTGKHTLTAKDADNQTLTFDIPDEKLGMTIDGSTLSWTPQDQHRGVHEVLLRVSDGTDSATFLLWAVVYSQRQAAVDLSFSSLKLYEADNTFVKLRNLSCPEPTQNVTLKNMANGQETMVSCRKINRFEYVGKFVLTQSGRSDLPVNNGDEIQAIYAYGRNQYSSNSYYSTQVQPSDETAPSAIGDLGVVGGDKNQAVLKWTAPGDDGSAGTALKYDIRYAFAPIATEADYLVATPLYASMHPKVSGTEESWTVDLKNLAGASTHDQIYFSVKAEDEMQNRSPLGNCAAWSYMLEPENLQASLKDVYKVELSWNEVNRGSTGFQYYMLYRKLDEKDYVLLADNLAAGGYVDDLKNLPDGKYQYALRAVYITGMSDFVYSAEVAMARFADIRIACNLAGAAIYDGIEVSLKGMDAVYAQTFQHTTDTTGLVLLKNVYKSTYDVSISKSGYGTTTGLLTVSDTQKDFVFELTPDGQSENRQYFRYTNLAIPDNDPSGIEDTIHVDMLQRVGKVEVYLDIAHPSIGDLLVQLTSPTGTKHILHNQEGGSEDDIRRWYLDITAFRGEIAQGDWVLGVSDKTADNGGTLNQWRLKVYRLEKSRVLDLNADRNSDILWRHEGGTNAVWLMDGKTVAQGAVINSVDTTWNVVGSGDFTGDGKSDILWRHAPSGTNVMWVMDGVQVHESALLNAVDADWKAAGTGDFDGDSMCDILWRHAPSGTNCMWLMNGTQIQQVAIISAVDATWDVVGTGDFDGDSMCDILWRHAASGTNCVWSMQGTQVKSSQLLNAVDSEWAVEGTGDFDADGTADILWRHAASGTNAVWRMKAAQVAEGAVINAVDPAWKVAGVGDLNADGKSDILWRHAPSGSNVIYFMDGFTVAQSEFTASVDATWSPAGYRPASRREPAAARTRAPEMELPEWRQIPMPVEFPRAQMFPSHRTIRMEIAPARATMEIRPAERVGGMGNE